MTVRASRGRSLLVALLAAGGLRALALSGLPASLFAVVSLAVIGTAARDIAVARRPVSLVLDGEGLWHVGAVGEEPFAGRLLEAGYRSAAVIVLVFERDRPIVTDRPRFRAALARVAHAPERRRVAVFADGVDAADFSFLHLQLAFAAGSAERRSP